MNMPELVEFTVTTFVFLFYGRLSNASLLRCLKVFPIGHYC